MTEHDHGPAGTGAPRSPGSKNGMAIPIAIGVLLILALLAFAVYTIRRHSYRGIGWANTYLRAVSAGEACYTRLISRLAGSSWESRWFANGRDAGGDSWMGDSYTYLLADRPPLEAELVVWGRCDNHEVPMYWRLRADPNTLSPYRQVKTVYFTFLSPAQAAVGLGPLSTTIDQAIQVRDGNATWHQTVRGRLMETGGPAGPLTVLNIPAATEAVGQIQPLSPSGNPTPVDPGTGALGNLSPPAVPGLPVDQGGAVPPGPRATPETVRTFATTRDKVERALDNVKNLGVKFSQIFPGRFAELRDRLKDCASVTCGGGAISISSGSRACCDCYADVRRLSGQVLATRAALEECIQGLSRVASAMDSAATTPGPSESRANELIGRANSVMTCEQQSCQQVRQLVGAINRAASPCGRQLDTGGGGTASCPF
ncbi:MAG: hypothetical protein HY815_10935 [Candidatus Riflebacteria bacterium]|nr:hypothetical protein [Candidatus Riflebacteria bacterium]